MRIHRFLGTVISALVLGVAGPGAAAVAAPFPADAHIDRVVVNPGGDASTTAAVSFRGMGRDGAVEIDPPYGNARTEPATAVLRHGQLPAELDPFSGTGEHFSAVLGGLRPGVTYRYRPVVDGRPGAWAEFSTATESAEPFSFLYFGDAQNSLTDVWPKVTRHAFAHAPEAALIVQPGDQVDLPNIDHEWADFFTGLHGQTATRPYLSAPGNHELMLDPMLREHRAHFEYPYNGHAAFPETTYFVDYQGVRFVTLHANYMGLEQQNAWLDSVLTENPHQWAVVVFHQPVWSVAQRRADPVHNHAFRATLEHHDVDLVLTGHDHGYGRGHSAEREAGSGFHDGPVYVSAVSGGKYYSVDTAGDPWRKFGGVRVRTAGGLSTFHHVAVDGCRLTFEAIVGHSSSEATLPLVEGDVLDEFEIDKCGQGKRVTG